jgi:hypothetical protein
MQLTSKIAKTDTTNKMTVAFDISKGSVEYFSEVEGKLAGNSCREVQELEGSAANRTPALTAALNKLFVFCRERGFDGLHVVCEPTGCYSEALLRLARRMGHTTAWVSGEAVHKARVIENNDGGKDDIKDPRTIFMLSRMGKELVYRTVPPEYKRLRHLNHLYNDADKRCVQAKGELHSVVKKLFCDFPMGKDFLKTPSGAVLVARYSCSPNRIVADGFDEFYATMRKDAPRILKATLRSLYTSAQYSALHHLSVQESEALELAVRWMWEDLHQAQERKEQLRILIAQGYEKLREAKEMLPIADGKVFTAFSFGRILGETGPLRDFANWRVLFKYGGLNLRKRESGTHKGKLKLSKKGRIPLRLVLGKLIFGMVRGREIFGPYYHRRKNQDPNHIGTKVMANAERKLLRMVFGMARRGEAFNQERFTTCESQYRMAA